MRYGLILLLLTQSIPLEGPRSAEVSTVVMVATQREPATVLLAWDPVPLVAGYIVYIGTTPGVYTRQEDVGLTTDTPIQLSEPGTYYFAVSAYVDAFPSEPGSLRAPGKPIMKGE